MDNRITKKRLYDFFAYEWIAAIVAIAAVIFVFEMIFATAGVRLQKGQSFNYYFDETVYSESDSGFYNTLINANTFSFDVKEVGAEILLAESNVLYARVANDEACAIFTDNGGEYVRAKMIIDSYTMFTLEDVSDKDGLLYKATEYLKQFTVSGGNPLDFNDLDKTRIKSNFELRTSARVYKNDFNAGLISVEDEYERIKKLCEDAAYFKKVIEYDAARTDGVSIFYSYKLGEQIVEAGGEVPSGYEQRTAKKYGINMSALGVTAKDVFKVKEGDGDVILLAFNRQNAAPDLCYETISFLDMVIKKYADFADKL